MTAGRALIGWMAVGGLAAGVLVLALPTSGPTSGPGGGERAAAPGGSALALLPEADPAAGARLFGRCAACHTVGPGGPDLNGPNLHAVLGAPVAGNSRRYGYTHALRAVGGQWDFARMDAWLQDPQQVAPGTRMVFSGLPSAQDRADLMAYLNRQGSNLPLPAPPAGDAPR